MGAISSYLIYRSGKKRGARSADLEIEELEEILEELHRPCNACGHLAMQHSSKGHCPTYPE